jgi:hypothetical protein
MGPMLPGRRASDGEAGLAGLGFEDDCAGSGTCPGPWFSWVRRLPLRRRDLVAVLIPRYNPFALSGRDSSWRRITVPRTVRCDRHTA